MIQVLLIFLGVLVVYSLISIVFGIVQIIASKGEKGLRNILTGIVSLVILALIGFGTCVFALNI